MKATLDCLECIATQALRAARRATEDEAVQREVLNVAMRSILNANLNVSPAVISLDMYNENIRLSGNPDPYLKEKQAQNAMALALEAELRDMVQGSDAPIITALHLAAAGNIIDLGLMKDHHIDVHQAIAQAMHERFAVDHSAAFMRDLETCRDLVYLLDNAGEIVFDKILIDELVKYTNVTAVVKGMPCINDACQADAVQVGLTDICDVVDNGGAFIGNPLELISKDTLRRMDQADIIIGKGQGNYETVDVYPGNVYLILKAKCKVVARHMGVALGQVGMISTRIRGDK